jgi:hypothetical protein
MSAPVLRAQDLEPDRPAPGQEHGRGSLRPRRRARLDASFTSPGASESLFVIGIDNCQANTIGHRVLAIFPLTGSPKATLRWDEHDVGESRGSFVAILQKSGEPARLLETDGRLIELNRDFVAGAPGASPSKRASQGGGRRRGHGGCSSRSRLRPATDVSRSRSHPRTTTPWARPIGRAPDRACQAVPNAVRA